MKTSSLLLAKHAEHATPHRRLYQPRYRPTLLDLLDLAAYCAAFIVAMVAIHTFAG